MGPVVVIVVINVKDGICLKTTKLIN